MTIPLLPSDPHDTLLAANVHPPDWQNPTPADRYHMVVIGAGTAGLVAAAGAAGLGARVALVERDLMGGDCLNVGCVPSKALIRAARAAAAVRDAGAFGIQVPHGVRIDFPAIMERMRHLRAQISPHDSASRFRGLGVDVFLGNGQFTGPDTLTVAGQTLRFRRAVIATGARAEQPPIPGLREAGFLTNENVFTLTELPLRLAVIGAGPVGCELAQAFARFGSQVFLIGKQPQVLPREDGKAARLVHDALARDGVHLLLGRSVRSVQVRHDGKALQLDSGDLAEIVADAILVGAGRKPNVDGLNLEAAGVAYDARKGVRVDDRLHTTNARIFAAGDICSRYQFTHTADATARIALTNALFPGRARVGGLIVPWCTYTDPEVAHVGLSARDAREQGIAVDAFVQELRDVDRAVLDGESDGYVEILVRRGSDRIVGATVVAAHAGDMISEITLAMTGGLGLRTIAKTIHPYPTQAEAIKKIGDAFNRTRLTRLVEWLFHKWFAWTR
jgi:pyruvate/2-oxoglutarate dehydrogenase complex dihydrolipoamide dehydrogenase (E3) component